MSSFNLQQQSAPYEPSQPNQSGRLDVTWSGGIGTVDAGKIVTKGGSRKHRYSRHRHSRKCGCGHKTHRKHQTRKARRSRR